MTWRYILGSEPVPCAVVDMHIGPKMQQGLEERTRSSLYCVRTTSIRRCSRCDFIGLCMPKRVGQRFVPDEGELLAHRWIHGTSDNNQDSGYSR